MASSALEYQADVERRPTSFSDGYGYGYGYEWQVNNKHVATDIVT